MHVEFDVYNGAPCSKIVNKRLVMSNKDHEHIKSSGAGERHNDSLFGDLEEEVSEGGQKVRHRGVYLLPNLFTTGALFCGFYAIVSGMGGNFIHASIAIFLAMLLDGMDGRVARMTNTQSAFGEQYDSLADMVSFGVAPALVMLSWVLHDLGRWGWAAAFIYTACAALRLARFNTQIGVVDKKYFIGLASPMAAAIIAALVLTLSSYELVSFSVKVLLAVVTVATGLLMVSNFRYTSFKSVDFRGRVPFGVMLLIVMVLAMLIVYRTEGLLTLSILYGLSAPFVWVLRKVGVLKAE
jgi:CDP-diacylglycerol--serine O-phosphatidyltransferase